MGETEKHTDDSAAAKPVQGASIESSKMVKDGSKKEHEQQSATRKDSGPVEWVDVGTLKVPKGTEILGMEDGQPTMIRTLAGLKVNIASAGRGY
ncbi:hypothetical protein MMC18_006151 [Xylographa bjoerkii]|nr:hypothetical protein [Xylographa bjoerkii]